MTEQKKSKEDMNDEQELTEEECLGDGCKYFRNNADGLCFHAGFLPRCSPNLREAKLHKLALVQPQSPPTLEALREETAAELFDIWKEAKEDLPDGDNWNDQTWEDLPEKHKHEYYLTADRICSRFSHQIEEARREERERIIKLLQDRCPIQMGIDMKPQYRYLFWSDWLEISGQSLSEVKE